MSDPSADSPRRGASAGCVVGIAFGLMVLAAAAAFLLVGTGGPVDGRAELRATLGVESLPGGLEIASATRMPTGETLIVLTRPGSAPEAPPAELPEQPRSEGQEPPRFDWSQVAIPAPSGPPRQVAVLLVQQASGRAVLDALIRDVRGEDRRHLGPQGGTVLLARGTLSFRGYDAEWIHLRTYEPGPAFRDTVRISLSTPEKPCVLTASWPRGSAASRALLEELIAPIQAAAH